MDRSSLARVAWIGAIIDLNSSSISGQLGCLVEPLIADCVRGESSCGTIFIIFGPLTLKTTPIQGVEFMVEGS